MRKFLNSPHIDHWNIVIILRFIKGALGKELVYENRGAEGTKILLPTQMQIGLDLLVKGQGDLPPDIVFYFLVILSHGRARNKMWLQGQMLKQSINKLL